MADTIILRRFTTDGKELIALIPDAEANRGMVMSYMHVGQHSEASYPGILDITQPANPRDEDAVSLIVELSRIGYEVQLRRRMPSWRKRRAA